jgi:hypothetical protein
MGARTFSSHCKNNIGSALPKNLKVKVILWKERDGGTEFHERLIVTDMGGVLIDPGIDEGADGREYTLRLLSKKEIQEYFEKFAPASSPYEVVDQIEIIAGE